MNSFGNNFRVTVFGESHGPVVGCVIDGVPVGIELSEGDFAADIARRAAGAEGTTPRREPDTPRFLSGVFNGHTTGSPLTIVFDNTNTRSEDYAQFAATPRPGHADFVAAVKFDGANDPRGGGHFAGRLTLPIVAAGVVAKKMLGMEISPLATLGQDDSKNVISSEVEKSQSCIKASIVAMGGSADKAEWPSLLEAAKREGDSLGAIIECSIEGLPIGLGEPFWDSVESMISHAVFAIPGVRGVEFGDGFKAAAMKGSEHNDPFGPDGPVKNGAGGVNGGITNGAPVVFRVAFKPTSSVARAQKTWNYETESEETLEIKGRHDVCFALRCPVIVEAMASIVLADLLYR
ncbi:MAG: chorismate synthase [Bacteroidales bacterium]|nr:chorismate synthase [Bacteroidales bacterium]